ncbi:MAG: hypothetical protein KAU50_10340 [Candidatus Marinimicrobia bacterium]|nr:hypothetical protein [Candidatus Neomarinimicrobiota bacterium]
MRPFITAAVEGYPDEAVVRRICDMAGFGIAVIHRKRGKDQLDKNLLGYNNAARFAPWFVLRDLDHDAVCAPELYDKLLPSPAPKMHFRIVVREVEAWILGDRTKCAQYFRISKSKFPLNPENLEDPKAELIRIVSRFGSYDMREEIVPIPGGTAKEGPAYASRIADFAQNHWSPLDASRVCDSLQRCLSSLQSIR